MVAVELVALEAATTCDCADSRLLALVGVACLTSVFVDVFEHALIYSRGLTFPSGHRVPNRWPLTLPISGVLLAAILRAGLAMGSVIILNVAVDTSITLVGAAAVGLALPRAVELFFGVLVGDGFSGQAADEGSSL